jgi:hypothetical protein
LSPRRLELRGQCQLRSSRDFEARARAVRAVREVVQRFPQYRATGEIPSGSGLRAVQISEEEVQILTSEARVGDGVESWETGQQRHPCSWAVQRMTGLEASLE